MRRSMELKHRKYELSKDKSGRAWFELYAELANCHELLEETAAHKTARVLPLAGTITRQTDEIAEDVES